MERPHSQNYLKGAHRPAFGSIYSLPSVAGGKSRDFQTSSKNQYTLKLSKPVLSSPHLPGNRFNHSKDTFKIPSSAKNSSVKRKRGEEDKGPFKKASTDHTGLEKDFILDDLTPRSASTTTLRQIEIYARRRKVADYAATIRAKKVMSKKIRRDWVGMPASSQQGLKNLTGALCYRLSLLQALLHQPRFVHWLEDSHHPDQCVSDDRDRCAACCLRTMSLEYWKGNPGGALKGLQSMDSLFKSLGWAPDRSSGHADPDEMMTWIFAQLSREIPSSLYSCLEGMTQPIVTATVSCRCGHESKTTGHQDSALPLPILPTIRNGTVAQYLEQYMVEKVEGYCCEGCNNIAADKVRKQVINNGPDILTIQLKRTDEFGRKINSPVIINRTLDLTKYQHARTKEPLQYELIGVIKHRGSLDLGHYICFVKAGDGQWYEFDDRRKSSSSFAAATNHADKFTPYMIFFQRQEI